MKIYLFDPAEGSAPITDVINMEDIWQYGTKVYNTCGLTEYDQPSPVTNMGEIEASAEWKPALRFGNISDALTVWLQAATVKTHKIGDIGGGSAETSLTGGPDEAEYQRYMSVWLAEWLGIIRTDPDTGAITGRPRVITPEELFDYSRMLPFQVLSYFSDGGLESGALYQIAPEFYWETSGGSRTGAVYTRFYYTPAWRYSWRERENPGNPNSSMVTRYQMIRLTSELYPEFEADLTAPATKLESRTFTVAGVDFTMTFYAGLSRTGSNNPYNTPVPIPADLVNSIDIT